MAQFGTEEQQVEAIKTFWKENGTAIILGSIIGFGGLFGWRYFQDYKQEQAEMASANYSAALKSITAGQTENPEFVKQAKALISEHGDTTYATLAAFKLVQQYVINDKFDQAAEQLQWVVDQGNSTFKATAQIRFARILLQQDKFAEAAAMAKSIEADSHKSTRLLLEGESMLGQDKKVEAIALYKQAKEAAGTVTDPLLAMRVTEFGIE